MAKFPENKDFNLSKINIEILEKWNKEDTFQQSLETRKDKKTFVFYEGPPSANGMPGIHHVMARTIKDIFCRYKTQKDFLVYRKAGWDTHGLPVELSVEKALGITKEDIGEKISIAEYNEACKKDVMKYTDVWEDLTAKMGFWLDTEDPYITYESQYMETLWWLLKKLHDKGFLYKGYSIQPYSPAAGTGLSSHELNLPGCYKDVKDTSAIAQFIVTKDDKSKFLYNSDIEDVRIMAWTTTPWTLPSNTALAVGKNITYVKVETYNQYTFKPVSVILAKDRLNSYFPPSIAELLLENYKEGDKKIPFKVIKEYTGEELAGVNYSQLIDWVKPKGDAFRVVVANFVTTEDGTGVVHIAPTFGADDFRVGQDNNIVGLLVDTKDGGISPLVDKQGRMIPIEDMASDFVTNYVNTDSYSEFAGRFVKNEYSSDIPEGAKNIDVDISVQLKIENKAFKVEKYEHSYPHCWRTDKPVLYYPLDSWFVKTTSVKERMIELNKTITWQPPSTGSGRFGKWLENLVDWNLSRSRYWGTPLPIWRTEDGTEEICIGSFEQLKEECQKAVEVGFMDENPLKDFVPGNNSKENYKNFDPHRPYVDEIFLVSASGRKMSRESDLIDVWFDSGAMPYSQLHYPFDNDEFFKEFFPADFIAEGVDQTRGWFFTLHALAVMLFDSVAFKNIISNGLVLDKKGNKMSKRLGNAVDPFITIGDHGSDPLRWYMMTNASPWDNLKFDASGIEEVKRKFFGTLFNTYSFFALYANVDGFNYSEEEIPISERPEIDRWVISLLNTLIKDVEQHYENYDPTKAARAIQQFVMDHLSNWYVRLNRKRYWMSDYSQNKISAYQTLYNCLETVAKLSAPIAPFYMDKLFCDLTNTTGSHKVDSVHLATFPVSDETLIDKELEARMSIAQKISSMVLSLRRKVNIKVRQPLNLIKAPVNSNEEAKRILDVKDIILTEVNVKEIEIITGEDKTIIKKIKPNFKVLGPRFGKTMKLVAGEISKLDQTAIAELEATGNYTITLNDEAIDISLSEVEIGTEDIPGWLVATDGARTIALDINISEELREEGIAREFVNRIQNLRKESGLDVTDKIVLNIQKHSLINSAIVNYNNYICSQTLSVEINLLDKLEQNETKCVEIDEKITTNISIKKII